MSEAVEQEIRDLQSIRGSERDPEGLAFASLADAFRRNGKIRDALSLLTEGTANHPDFATGHVVLTRLYHEQGMSAEAEISARRVLELDPRNLVALSALAEILQEQGKEDEASGVRWMLADTDPGSAEAAAVASLPAVEPSEGFGAGPVVPASAPSVDEPEAAGTDELIDLSSITLPEEPSTEPISALAPFDDEADPALAGDLDLDSLLPSPETEFSGLEAMDDSTATQGEVDTVLDVEPQFADVDAVAHQSTDRDGDQLGDEASDFTGLMPEQEVEFADLDALGPAGGDELGGHALAPDHPSDLIDLGVEAPEAPVEETDLGVLPPGEPLEIADLDALAPDEPADVMDLGALAPDEPADVMDLGALAPDEPADVMDLGALAPDEPADVMDLGALAPDEPADVMDLGALAPDEPADVMDLGALAPDEPADVMDLGALAPDEPADVMDLGALAPDDEPADVMDLGALAPDDEPADVMELGALAPDEPADVMDLGALAPDEPADVMDLGALAPDDEPADVMDLGALAPDDEPADVMDLGALAPDEPADVMDLGALAPDLPSSDHDEDGTTPGEVKRMISEEPIHTRTLAELYVKQGFDDQALAVYRSLLESEPGAQDLIDRIAELEAAGADGSASVDPAETSDADFAEPDFEGTVDDVLPPVDAEEALATLPSSEEEVEALARELAEAGSSAGSEDVDTPFAWTPEEEAADQDRGDIGRYFDSLLDWKRGD